MNRRQWTVLHGAVAVCALSLVACKTLNAAHKNNNSDINQYYERYPTAPKGQAEYFFSREYEKEVRTFFDCIERDAGFFDSELRHLPSLQIHIGIKGNAKSILKRCTDNSIFVAHSVNFSYVELWNKALEITKTLKSQGIAHHIDTPTAQHGRTVLNEVAYNKIIVSVLADNITLTEKALSSYGSDSIILISVETLPIEIINYP